jgi:hypothetical protein
VDDGMDFVLGICLGFLGEVQKKREMVFEREIMPKKIVLSAIYFSINSRILTSNFSFQIS